MYTTRTGVILGYRIYISYCTFMADGDCFAYLSHVLSWTLSCAFLNCESSKPRRDIVVLIPRLMRMNKL